jgi:hypothetical protein
VLYPVAGENGEGAVRADYMLCRHPSGLRPSGTPGRRRILWYYLAAYKYVYYEATPTLDTEPPLVGPDRQHLRTRLVMGMVNRRGTDSTHSGGPIAVLSHCRGQAVMDTLLLLIYIYIGLFGLIIGVLAWGIHREGQRHDPER